MILAYIAISENSI